MQKWLLVLGVLIVIGIGYGLFFNSESTVTNYPSANQGPIVAFGDSLVAGVGATRENDFVSVVSRELGVPIQNLGQAGDTTRDGLERLDDVLAEKPKLVLLLLGGNDYLQDIPPAETFANLGTMIESIHDTGAMVVLLGVRGGLFTDSYKQEYEVLSKRYQTAYVPNVLDGLFGNPRYMADTIHPNDAGYTEIADRVAPVVNALLQL